MAKRIIDNFVGGSRQSDINLLSLSYTLNMYAEAQGQDSPAQTVLRSILGHETFVSLPGVPRGSFAVSKGYKSDPRMFAVFGAVLYAIDLTDGQTVVTEVGRVLDGTRRVTMCETIGEMGNSPYLVIADGFAVHAVPTDAHRQELAAGYRGIRLPVDLTGRSIRPTHVTYEFGYLTVNDADSDNFYVSYQYPFESVDDEGMTVFDVFTYDPLEKVERPEGWVIAADWCSDVITAMCSTNSRLYTFGPRSIQYFNSTNDATMPFNSPDTSSLNIGIQAPYSLATIGQDLFFLGSSTIGQNGIYRMSGGTPERISNSDIERAIAVFGNKSDAIGSCWSENSHVFYAITFQQDERTFVYDLATGQWHNRSTHDTKRNAEKAWRYSCPVMFDGRLIFQTEGALTYEKEGKFTEHDSNTCVRMRRGGCTIDSYNPFVVDNVIFNLSNGYVDYDRPRVNPKVMFRYSADGTTFGNERIGYMGCAGQYSYVTQFPRLGIGRFFAFELSCSEDCDFIILPPVIHGTAIARGF